jgi:hypothetical protein
MLTGRFSSVYSVAYADVKGVRSWRLNSQKEAALTASKVMASLPNLGAIERWTC